LAISKVPIGKESWLQSDEEGAPSYSADSGRLTNLLVGVYASYCKLPMTRTSSRLHQPESCSKYYSSRHNRLRHTVECSAYSQCLVVVVVAVAIVVDHRFGLFETDGGAAPEFLLVLVLFSPNGALGLGAH